MSTQTVVPYTSVPSHFPAAVEKESERKSKRESKRERSVF